jgi:hypothetical protein
MPVSTELKQEEQKLAIPQDDYEMFSRENFDQKQLRFEFAAPQDIAIDQEDIKTQDESMIDPRTLEMPVGPAGAYDDFGSGGGMEEVVVDGEEWTTHVYNHGFSWHPDMDSVDSVGRQRTHVQEMFQYLFDLNFMLGLDADNDGSINPGSGPDEYGMIDWLRNNIASERTFDAENYDGDTGDTADYSDTPEDLLRGDAMKSLRGRVLDINSGWDLMLGSHDAIMNFMGYSAGETTMQERGPTFMERLRSSDTVQEAFTLPYTMQPDYLPRDARSELPDVMAFDLVDESTAVNPGGSEVIGDDEVFLIPDTDTWVEEFVDLREMGSPEVYGPVDQRGGKRAWDYKNRFGLKWDPFGEHPNATDCVHVKNVSTLFGPNN